MSDDWLKKAESLREQNHPNNAVDTAGQKAQQQKFYRDNLPKVQHILVELGNVWKSQDSNHPGVLGIGGHPGNDYYVYINPVFQNKIALG